MSTPEEKFRAKIEEVREITKKAIEILQNKKSALFISSLPVSVPESTSDRDELGSQHSFHLEDDEVDSQHSFEVEDEDEDQQVMKATSSDAVETWVALKAKEMKKEGVTEVVKKLSSDELPKDSKDAFTSFERMTSSGNENDCLVHSLLTSLSATFRTLEKADKDSIASQFRREILWNLLNESKESLPFQFTKVQMDQMLAETRTSGFLSDLHLRYLVNKYKFNVFFYELGAPRTDPWHLLMPYDDSERAPLILLYNPGRNHFEAVRDPKSDKYVFELALLKPFRSTTVSTNQALVDKERGLQRCPFILWDVIKKKGTEDLFVVVDQVEQDGKCVSQFVTRYNADKKVIKHIVNKPREHKDERFDIFPTKDDYELATPASRHYDEYKAKGGKQTRKNRSKK